ncbi:MFS transporter [Nocardiopsis composta]|uniref:DHA1 family inner membrane transport protein n=1 Tax=Nocardiopsis composta TaxID=157465 RepID=A0A7W8QN26_9ACTN|nr:MFS transporter [Nocardiopsis composta]MBB5433453.1 DHA1 family inner membrane transport protein [Nocardiopsis composta]
MPIALWALTLGAFGIGTTEFVIMGLLPEVAGDLGVSIPTAGHLISGYAAGVVVGAPLLAIAGSRLPRRTMLLALLALFTVANAVSAVAPGYEALLGARVLAGLPHGAFLGIGSVVAADMVAGHRRGQAVARVLLGLTLANVVGVPLGALMGQQIGWRWAFAAVAVIGAVSLVALRLALPEQPRPAPIPVRAELRVFRRPQVLLAFAVVVFGFGGSFAAYGYISPMLTEVTGLQGMAVTLVLALYGAGMTVGAIAGGRLADRAPMPTLWLFTAALAVLLALFTVTVASPILAPVTFFLIGATGFIAVTSLQTMILDRAKEAPGLAAAGIHSAFNIANAMGATLGGAAISAGFGLASPSMVGALLSAVGLGLALLMGMPARRAAVVPDPVTEVEPVPAAEAALEPARA